MGAEQVDPWAIQDTRSAVWNRWRTAAVVAAPCGGFVVGAVRGELSAAALGATVLMSVLVGVALLTRPPKTSVGFWTVAAVPVMVAAAGAVVFGRAPVLVVIWGTVLADVAIGGRWIDRSPHRYAEPLMPVAVLPLVVAGLMAVAGQPAAALASLGLAFAILVAAATWVVRFQQVTGVLDRFVASVAEGLGVVVTVGLALPMLYLPGAIGRLLRGSFSPTRQSSTGWTTIEVSNAAILDESLRMFSSTPVALRRHRLFVSLGVVGLLGLVVVSAGDEQVVEYEFRSRSTAAADSQGGTPVLDPRTARLGRRYSDRPAYKGALFADQLQSEQQEFIEEHLVFDSTAAYVSGDFGGDYTVTRAGARRTVAHAVCVCRPVRLWLLGGSAAFGMGQRDEHTIASELVNLAAADGFALDVVNYAVPGWVIDQEIAMTEQYLDNGEKAPDLVVFYDGYNDAFLAAASAATGSPVAHQFSELDQSAYEDFRRSVKEGGGVFADAVQSAGGPEAIGEAAARRYLRSRDLARTALDARGVDSRFLMQTDAMVAPQHRDDGVLAEPALESRIDGDIWATVLESMETGLRRGGVTSLRRVVASTQEPLFLDSVHTNELGARVVAAAMYAEIRTDLDRLAPLADPDPGGGS